VLSRDDIIGNEDDVVVGSLALDGLAAGEAVTDTVALDLDKPILNEWALEDDPVGEGAGHGSNSAQWLGLVVDPEDVIGETDEANNISTLKGTGVDDITYFPWDANDSGMVTPTDAIFLINRLGDSGADLDGRADPDGSGVVTPTDAIAVINRLGYEMNMAVVEVASEAAAIQAGGAKANDAFARVPVVGAGRETETAYLAEFEFRRRVSGGVSRVSLEAGRQSGDAGLAGEDGLGSPLSNNAPYPVLWADEKQWRYGTDGLSVK
jgi:hypothetical protein